MPGFQQAKAMVSFSNLKLKASLIKFSINDQVFAGVYPVDSNDFTKLEESVRRVRLCLILSRRTSLLTLSLQLAYAYRP